MHYYRKRMASPVGELTLLASERGLAAVLWDCEYSRHGYLQPVKDNESHPLLLSAATQLEEYFSGRRRRFDLPLAVSGTEFQKKVWAALLTIPYGETRSYQQIARQTGHEKAVRAVGAANGRNPVSIIIPCHRVIGASGKLTGFAGGLSNKAALLHLETSVMAGLSRVDKS